MSLLHNFVHHSPALLGALSDWIPDFMRSPHMTPRQRVSLLLPVAYFLGSIPFGVIVGRLKGVDITRHGSRNIGATNVGRLLGRKYFYIVFVLDMLKGLIPMLLAGLLLSDVLAVGPLNVKQNMMWMAIGFACIIGHMFSAFLKFRGGKGIATTAGVILGLFPYFTLPGLGIFAVWGLFFAVSRYVSLASIAAAISFPILYVAIGLWQGWPVTTSQLPLGIFAVIVALLIVYKHRSNIQRLMKGEERHFHFRKSGEHHHGEAEASA